MLIVNAVRTARYAAHVRVIHIDYHSHPSRSWTIWEGDVRVRHGLSARQAAALIAESICAALDQSEELPVGESVDVLLPIPWPHRPVGQSGAQPRPAPARS